MSVKKKNAFICQQWHGGSVIKQSASYAYHIPSGKAISGKYIEIGCHKERLSHFLGHIVLGSTFEFSTLERHTPH